MTFPPYQVAAMAALLAAACGVALHALSALRLHRHLHGSRSEGSNFPPLTLWRALKGGVPDLAGKLDALALGSRTEDQILIGVEEGSAESNLGEEFCARHPHRDIAIVPCRPGAALNPKISKFIQMHGRAKHSHWMLTDAESVPDMDFIEKFRREWEVSGAQVLTAGYRFTNLRTIFQSLDAAPALLTLWPGLMLAGRLNFTLGACTGVRAEDVHAIGGWAALSDELAEDHRLGSLLAEKGRTIRLSRNVLSLDGDPMGVREYLRHQHRVAVTYRAVNPMGAIGLPLLHATPLAWTAMAIVPHWWQWAASLIGLRFILAAVVARLLHFPLRKFPFAAVVAPVVETLIWLSAWIPCKVWWAGDWRRISWRGRMQPRR